jgi:branched-chain amino acid transport system ATP-binding protein
MLAIARALLTNPKLVIMDEPSEGLAPVIVDHLCEVLRGLRAERTGLLLVEQELGPRSRHGCRQGERAHRHDHGRAGPARDEAAQNRYLGVAQHGH